MKIFEIRLFANSWSDIVNEVICCCSRMTFHFPWIITRKSSPIHTLDPRIAYKENFFLHHWVIWWLRFNQVIIIVVSICCCFTVVFIRVDFRISFFISDSIKSTLMQFEKLPIPSQMKITCWRFHIKAPFAFEIYTPVICETFL